MRNAYGQGKDKSMKVKVKKVKKIPAPVMEQGKERTFTEELQTFRGRFNRCYANRNHLTKPQSLNKHCDSSNIHLLFNSRNNEALSDEDIEELCRNYKLTRVPIDMLSEMILENLYVKNGKSFALVPLLWMLNYIS